MNWILDGFTVALIVIFAVTSYKKGFLNAVVRFGGMVLAFAASITASRPAAEFIYDKFIAGNVETVVKEHMGAITATDVAAFTEGMGELIDELPYFFSRILQSGFGVHVEEWYGMVLESHSESMTEAVLESIIAPLATGLIRVIVFFVLFTLIIFLVNAVAGLLIGVNKLPVVGSLNEVLGGALGAAQGMLYMFVVAAVIWLALSVSGGELGPLSDGVIRRTIIFKDFYNIGPWVETTAGLL